ncbi:unnamed protein product [Pseudo-nitzschia multistriata]|uniref:Uncharacterized protein n=1 Tax=Pseudo-nitzschia multistriata TaxID=183589 RepID=A0A448Z6W6_9STRA|nr:unnamed protein product [Pseudo-nitzschia multistriata]
MLFKRLRSLSEKGRSADVTNNIKSAAGSIFLVRWVWSIHAEFVPGVSIRVKSSKSDKFSTEWTTTPSNDGDFGTSMAIDALISVSKESPLYSSPTLSSETADVRDVDPATMVIESVVGSAPVSRSFVPKSALIKVDFPALNSPAITTEKVASSCNSSRKFLEEYCCKDNNDESGTAVVAST